MSKLNRILLILLAIQLGVFTVSRIVGTDNQPEKPKKLFADFSADQVTQIKITDDSNKSVELKKSGDKWVLASGGDYPVQKDKVDELLAKLPALTVGKPVVTKPELHRALEVADSKFQRRLRLTREGKDPIEFLLGSSPGIKKVHLRLAGQDPVYAVSDLSTWDIGSAANNWINTDYLKLSQDKVVSLTLRNASGEIQLLRGAGSTKLTLADLKGPEKPKQSEIDALLSSASTVPLEEPVGQQIDPSYGLEAPQATLTLVTETEEAPAKDGAKDKATDDKGATDPATAETKPAAEPKVKRTTYVLTIGAKKDESYYAKSDSSPFVVRLSSWSGKTLVEKKREDLLEKEDEKKVGVTNTPQNPGFNPTGG